MSSGVTGGCGLMGRSMSWILKWKSSLRLHEPGPAIDWKKVQVRESLRLHEHGLDSIAVGSRSEGDSYRGSSEGESSGEAFHRFQPNAKNA
jgi:hypothetical protein